MMTTNVSDDNSSGAPRRRAGWVAWLLLAPLLLWLFVFVVAPSGIMLFYSFCQRGELGEVKVAFETKDINGNGRIDGNEASQPPRNTTFDNYRRVFDPGFNPRKPYDSRGVPMYLVIIGKALLFGAIVGGMSAGAAYFLRVDDPMAMSHRRQLLRWMAAAVLVIVVLLLNEHIETAINHLDWNEWASLPLRAMKYGLLVAPIITAITPVRPIYAGLKWGIIIGLLLGFDREIENVVASGNQLKTLWRSVKYAGYTTVICVVIGYPVAYFIGRASESMRNKLLMAVMIPFWTSFLVRTYAWITILKSEGTLNGVLDITHLSKMVAFFGFSQNGHLDLLYTPFAVMIGLVYSYLPFMILPIYGSVEKLDNAMVEAAFDLGAAPIRAFQHVIIPLTQPGIVAGCLLVFIPAIGMFAIQTLLGGGQVPLIGDVIASQFGKARDWPFGSALGMTLVFIFVAVYWISSRRKTA